MAYGPPRRSRARPVADAPVDALVARAEDLAKGWLLALVEDAPLADAPELVRSSLVRHGPGLCEAIVRALADEDALGRLSRMGGVVPVPGRSAAEVSAAVDALHSVMWGAVRLELVDPDAAQVAALAERLARVVFVVRAAALSGSSAVPGPGGERWPEALEDALDRAGRSSRPLSLLSVALGEPDLVVAVEGEEAAAALFGGFRAALREAAGGAVVVDEHAHAWVIAEGSGRAEGVALGERLAAAVREGGFWRGAPLGVSVGVAVLGEDGDDPSELIAAAEEARFVAEAAGLAVGGSDGVGGGG